MVMFKISIDLLHYLQKILTLFFGMSAKQNFFASNFCLSKIVLPIAFNMLLCFICWNMSGFASLM